MLNPGGEKSVIQIFNSARMVVGHQAGAWFSRLPPPRIRIGAAVVVVAVPNWHYVQRLTWKSNKAVVIFLAGSIITDKENEHGSSDA
ncbi:MAG: hypothetical protein AB1453_07225 [Chloroflexota bacterium]